MEQLIRNLMEQMNHQFIKIDNRFDQMDKRFEGIETRLDVMDKRFEGIETRLDGIDVRLDGIDNRLETLTETVNNHATEFRSHFKRIETKLDEHEKVFTVVADEIKGIKYDISHLSAKSGIHDTEISNLKKRMQI